MVAPIRFLSGRQQQQKIGIEGSTEDVKVLEVVGRVGIGTTIFTTDYQLDIRGDANIRDSLTVDSITVTGTGNSFSGITTFVDTTDNVLGNADTGAVQIDGGLGVNKNLTVGAGLSVVETAYIVGVSTFKDRVIFDSTNSIQIPVGTTAERDIVGVAVTGQIRYNTELSSFEGYGPGGEWGSLGGVKDVDQDTYIIPELSAGSDEDILYFYTGGNLSGTISSANGFTGEGGNLTLGSPTGGSYRAGAYEVETTDKVDDSIDELNYILGKLVPTPPDDIDGVALSLTGTAGLGRLCAGFTPTNNTGGDLTPSAGTQYTRNTDSTITTNYITEYGPGDSGTVTGFVNAVGVGTTTLNVSFGLYAVKSDNGTYGALQIANDKDAGDSTRNVGITSLFYEVYDARLINAASPDGFNKAFITQGSNQTQNVYWYEDPSTVTAPVISFSGVTTPSSPALNYSSGVPHYTESTNNNFTYVLSVENATGDMYTQNTFLNSDGQTSGFQNPGNKNYTDFAGGTNPPTQNYGVGSAVTTLISQTPRDLHLTLTSNHFTSFDATTPYGTHSNQRVGYSTSINIMGTTARTNAIDEDNILISSLGTGSGNATRVNAGSSGDNPTPVFTSWTANSSVATYESVVRGAVLRHDQTDYSSGYLPVGPDYSSGRTGAQYFQMELIRSDVSQFNITVTGTYGGCWVCMPDNSTWTTSLSGTNGWADMFQAYRGAGVPTSAEPGCATGGNMAGTSGTFTCTFGTESSSNDSNNRILIRWRLDSGDSITTMSFSAT